MLELLKIRRLRLTSLIKSSNFLIIRSYDSFIIVEIKYKINNLLSIYIYYTKKNIYYNLVSFSSAK